jgi:hypothetical protein
MLLALRLRGFPTTSTFPSFWWQFQANVPELDAMNHIQLERNEISDSLALPATIEIPSQVRINNDRIMTMK